MPAEKRHRLHLRCFVPGLKDLPEGRRRGEVRAEEQRRQGHRLRRDSGQDSVNNEKYLKNLARLLVYE